MTDSSKHDEPPYRIRIDKEHYDVEERELPGAQLRQLVTPPIPASRDLYEELPEDDDRLIENGYVVELWNGKVFYTAPARINPGA